MIARLTSLAATIALLLLALAVTGFFAARITGVLAFYDIPSGSMEPTLPIGSHVIVSNMPYWRAVPQRSDIVTLKSATNPRITYIKRIVGLPGDTVQMQNETVILNGMPLPRQRIDDYIYSWFGLGKVSPQRARRYCEILPSGREYTVIELAKNSALDNSKIFKVPPGHYFVLGDNRDNSLDSRVSIRFGFVPRENIRGKFISLNPVFQFIAALFKAIGF